jgi:LacI family transcriptional regulator
VAVTLKDIAERLGVSVATVSFALRGVNPGRFKLAEATVRRIQETAREMGYRPNRVAASLVQRETHVVGVMIPEAQSDFYGRVFSGISRGLRPDYLPLVALHDSEGRRERQYLNTMIGNRVDAVIAAFSGDPESIPVYRDLLQDYHIPLCLLDRAIPGIDAPVVRPEAARAGAIAVEALAELGHRRVVYGSANDGLDSVLACTRESVRRHPGWASH